jgi:hypothetical protein
VSFIGSLDQFDLSIILQKIEEYRKTGLLIVKQDELTIELWFRQGQLMCIGPVKPGVTAGARLVEAGVISTTACYSIEHMLGERRSNEYDAINAFIAAHYLNREGIMQWAAKEASQVLDVILTWENGDLYFEEDQLPPAHRYPVPLSITSLLPAALQVSLPAAPAPVAAPAQAALSYHVSALSPQPVTHRYTADYERHTDALAPSRREVRPQQVTGPLAPVQIDPLLIQPDMVLAPVDLSAYRESNAQVTLTPEQWQLLTHANGETTLGEAAHELHMLPAQVRRIACELQALGLVTILSPGASNMLPVMGGSAETEAFAGFQQADVAQMSYTPAGLPIETVSQWGNGGNGAKFQLGSGWVISPAPSQYAHKPEHNGALAQAG